MTSSWTLSGVTLATTGTSLKSLGNERLIKTANLIPISIPLSDSDKAQVFDFGGALIEIYLEGSITDTLANVQSFINSLYAKINGAQSTASSYSYSSPLYGSFTVKVDNFESNLDPGTDIATPYVKWKLKLIQTLQGV